MRKHLSLTALALLLLASVHAHAEVVDVDNEALAELIEQGIPVIDIRRPDEWSATGVIDGSHLLTFFDEKGNYDAQAFRSALDKIVPDAEPVVLICRTGRRTDIVTRWLSEKEGFATVYNVEDGILSWKRKGGETVATP